MRFNELSDTDKDYLSTIYLQPGLSHNEKMDILSHKFDVVGRTIRGWANKLGISSKSGDSKLSKQLVKAMSREIDTDTQILLVTSAQNKTAVNREFLQSLELYKEHLLNLGYKVQIVIIPIKYRNPTRIGELANKRSEDWWVDDIDPYLYYNKLNFGDTLIAADSRVVPTASMPLSGYESLASSNNLILGHPRIHYKTLPRFRGQKLRTMNTTGFCTLKHYSKSKAGDKAFIHHSYGFTIVEKKDSEVCFKPRAVKVNSDGSFTDLKYHVSTDGVTEINSCKGVVLGDVHHAQISEGKMNTTFKILSEINPKEVVLHDVLDAETMNYHESKDMFIKKRKIVEGRYLIKQEVDNTLVFIKNLESRGNWDISVVQSNHDDFIDKHINMESWKKDLHNSEAYLEYALIQQRVDLREYGNIFGYLVSSNTNSKYIRNDQGLFINDYQCGEHGDHGVNGARGNITSFKRLNQKMIIGHGHSPQIMDGVTMVGVSCNIDQYYTRGGLSSWAYADCIIHDSGKSQLVVYDNDYQISNFI